MLGVYINSDKESQCRISHRTIGFCLVLIPSYSLSSRLVTYSVFCIYIRFILALLLFNWYSFFPIKKLLMWILFIYSSLFRKQQTARSIDSFDSFFCLFRVYFYVIKPENELFSSFYNEENNIRDISLISFPTNSTSYLDIFNHDRDSMSMNST